MKLFFTFLVSTVFLIATLNASLARGGLITFTQPDGTEFEGYLKGDASFHWIESNSHVILYNADDKFYYNAELSKTGELKISKEKPESKREISLKQRSVLTKGSAKKVHSLDDGEKAALLKLQQKSRKGHRPR